MTYDSTSQTIVPSKRQSTSTGADAGGELLIIGKIFLTKLKNSERLLLGEDYLQCNSVLMVYQQIQIQGEARMLVQKRTPSGYYKVTYEDCLIAERTMQQFRGRNPASLSPFEKDAMIGALSTMVVAAGRGFLPSARVLSISEANALWLL